MFNLGLRRHARATKPDGSSYGLRYGGRSFRAASGLPLDGGLARPIGILTLLAAAVRHPGRGAALAALVLRTRWEDVLVSPSLAGQALREYFDRRALGILPKNRLCRGVLVLPDDPADYLRGHRRQALRTNLHRAAAAGIWCEQIEEREHILDEALQVLSRRRWHTALTDLDLRYVRSVVARSEMTFLVARDSAGQPLAIVAAVIEDKVCLIEWAVASTHEARWALHHHLVEVLIGRGVRYLLATGSGPFGALGYEPNVQSYQHLLGYELRHLSAVPAG